MSISSSCVTNKKNVILQAFTESRQYMGAGDYKEAINSYDAVYTRYPNEAHARENYIRTVEEIKRIADAEYDSKKYDLAEKIYIVLSNSYSKFKTFEKSLSFEKDYLDQRIKNCRIAQIEIQANNALAVGNFSGAIDIFKTSKRSYPDDTLFQKKFLGTVSEIYRVAERAQTEQNYSVAGKQYSLLSKNYQALKSSIPSLPFTKDSLEEKLRMCTSALTGKGLELYRKGKLKEAINVWQGILPFDPNNIEIKKAIENAKAQLKKIKKLTDGRRSRVMCHYRPLPMRAWHDRK